MIVWDCCIQYYIVWRIYSFSFGTALHALSYKVIMDAQQVWEEAFSKAMFENFLPKETATALANQAVSEWEEKKQKADS